MITIKRSLVKKLLSQPDSLDLLRQGLAEMAGQMLGRFAEAVCGLFDCRADHGKLQKRTCAQALKERDRKEFISLASSLGDKLERSAARSWKAFLQRRFEEGMPVSLKGARAGAVLNAKEASGKGRFPGDPGSPGVPGTLGGTGRTLKQSCSSRQGRAASRPGARGGMRFLRLARTGEEGLGRSAQECRAPAAR